MFQPDHAVETAAGAVSEAAEKFNAGKVIIEHVSNSSIDDPLIHLPTVFGIDFSVTKHVFMICFATIMSLLYLEEKSDIRLKPVGDAQQDEGARQLLASVADRKAT